MNNWFQQVTSLGQTIVATNVSSHWKVGIDFGDLMISRPYYQGKEGSPSLLSFGIRYCLDPTKAEHRHCHTQWSSTYRKSFLSF